ncbi:MAG: gliding motility protein GldB [Bacteroidaceae bacterium]|nr:gliding motility protein GldB [Bacteroidaceae bacterium]
MKRNLFLAILLALLCAVGVWSWLAHPWEGWALASDSQVKKKGFVIDRYDRLLDEYVSLGSYTALHRMNTDYTAQTTMLIEDVLELGSAMEPDVEKRMRYLYLDSTMQELLDAVHAQYNDISDIEKDFDNAFKTQEKRDPDFRRPRVYTQIGRLGRSIVVNDTLIGISLDKYLGKDSPFYDGRFTDEQRARMSRAFIVSDALNAYLEHKKPKLKPYFHDYHQLDPLSDPMPR